MKTHSANGMAHSTSLTFRNRHGFTYMALLAAIVIIGISLGAAGKYWQNVSLRDKEEELLFRGNQYRQALESYYKAMPGRRQYPASIDDLLKDSRSATGKRYLRQKFKDPITGEDFVEVRDQTRRIIKFHSSSDKEPLKKDNFADVNKEFVGKTKYSEWEFIPIVPPPIIPGHRLTGRLGRMGSTRPPSVEEQ